ncbi:MAG: alpha/beta fold hydrolase, partial [Thermoleophilia bacterium]|nr:alpha/beta fold hydrolase [Thermoleophilia bacterium]
MTTRIIANTELGHIADNERASIAIYEYGAAMPHRETARIALDERAAGGGGEIHLDVYPARGSNDTMLGSGKARGTVVFVGGLSAHALQYATFLSRLAGRGWNVVALDVRGHGRSSGRRGDFTMPMLLDDFRGMIAYATERFGGPVAFMGSSLGGYYGLVAANALDGIAVGVSHWIFDPATSVTKKDARMKPIALALNKVWPTLRMNTRGVANWDAVNESAELRARMYQDPLMTWKYTVRALAGGMTYSPRRPLNDLKVPHLVVIGAEDQMTPTQYTRKAFDDLQGDKTFTVIPKAGHMGG